MKSLFVLLGLLLAAVLAVAQPSEKAYFSAPGGFYENPFLLELFPFYPQHHVRYTINGNRPTAQSMLYTGPLSLDDRLYSPTDIFTIPVAPEELMYYPDSVGHCIVIRAAVFDENDSCISDVSTNSYFIRSLGCDTHGLPVVSLCADSTDLFDYHRGILVPGVWFDTLNPSWSGNYYQRGNEWERRVNVEYYNRNNEGINQWAGLRTHGGSSRRIQQKALKVFAREEYGKNTFEYRFFPTIPNDSFKRLILKPFCASWTQAGAADYVCNRMAESLNFESLASTPVVMFLNGEYWGIYYLHEKPDEHYLKEHFDIPIDSLNLFCGWSPEVEYGSGDDYRDFRHWLEEADLTEPENWERVQENVDIPCFIDYEIFEMFIENADWPANNTRSWQLQGEPLRWIFFDGDACLRYGLFDVFSNATYVGPNIWPSSTLSTLFFRKFLENPEFYDAFFNRFEQLLDSALSYSVTSSYLAEIREQIALEVSSQSFRFQIPESQEKWNHDMGSYAYFLTHRVEQMHQAIFTYEEVRQDIMVDSKVFPNPSDGPVTLAFEGETSGVAPLRVYDLLGREVYRQSVVIEPGGNTLTFDPLLPAGVYILKMRNFVAKIVRK